MRCIYCNNEIPDGSPVCGYCNRQQNMNYNNNMYNTPPNLNSNYSYQNNNYVNYNNYNNYNNGYNNMNNGQKRKKNNGAKIAIFFIMIFVIAAIAFSVFMFIQSKNNDKENKENTFTNNEINKNNEIEVVSPTKYIGSSNLGYVIVPRDWELSYGDEDYLYSDKSGNNQVSLTTISKEEADSYDAAMRYQVYFSNIRLQNIDIKKVQLKNYVAYKVSAFNPSTNQTTWIWTIDTNDGYTRIITIESLEDPNEYLYIPDSYTLTK